MKIFTGANNVQD